jgi:hypothetical protein
MKKRNLKSLKLNKRSISNLQQQEVKGGASILIPFNTCTILTLASLLACPEPDPVEPAEPPIGNPGPVTGGEIPSEVPFSITVCPGNF